MLLAALCNSYALNFFALGGFSIPSTFSAPTFLPSVPQPYLGLNMLQDDKAKAKPAVIKTKRIFFIKEICIKNEKII